MTGLFSRIFRKRTGKGIKVRETLMFSYKLWLSVVLRQRACPRSYQMSETECLYRGGEEMGKVDVCCAPSRLEYQNQYKNVQNTTKKSN